MTSHDNSWEEQIRRVEEEAASAFLAQNIDRLHELFADDLVVNSPFNRVNSKAQVLDLLQRGIIRHVSHTQEIERITRHDDFVFVMGHDVVRNSEDGPTITRRFTNVWCSAHGAWQLVGRQATVISQS